MPSSRSNCCSTKQRLRTRKMPPWPADPHVGHFRNDARLTAEEKALLLRWIDNGCPEGDASELPPPSSREGGPAPTGAPMPLPRGQGEEGPGDVGVAVGGHEHVEVDVDRRPRFGVVGQRQRAAERVRNGRQRALEGHDALRERPPRHVETSRGAVSVRGRDRDGTAPARRSTSTRRWAG